MESIRKIKRQQASMKIAKIVATKLSYPTLPKPRASSAISNSSSITTQDDLILPFIPLTCNYSLLLSRISYSSSLLASRIINIDMSTEQSRKLIQQARTYRCSKKGCLSQQRDPLDVVWFGQQYGQCKEYTCSSCYICNDEAVKASMPTNLNVLPLSQFIDKFVNQLKAYEQNKNGKQFFPKVMKERSKQLLIDLQKMQVDVTERLNQLTLALASFGKKIEEANLRIFKHNVFQEIIQMNSDGKMEGLLEKIMLLIQTLNVSASSDAYHFEDLQLRQKKLSKLSQQITDISQKSLDVLKQLYDSIREKNDLISKL